MQFNIDICKAFNLGRGNPYTGVDTRGLIVSGRGAITKGTLARFLGSVAKIEPKIMGSSCRNFGLGKEWERTGSLPWWWMNETDLVIILLVLSQ